jgi:hypothetical protein
MVLHGEHEGSGETERHAGRRLTWRKVSELAATIAFGALVAGLVVLEIDASSRHSPEKQSSNHSRQTIDESTTSGLAEQKIAEYTWWLSVFTAFLAVASFVEIGFLIVAAKTANETAKATNVLAKAAAEQRDVMREQMAATKAMQRAYIAVDGLGVNPFVPRDGISSTGIVHISIKNAGNVPARKVRWFIDAEIRDNDREKVFAIPREESISGSNVLAAQRYMQRDFSKKFTADDANNFLHNKYPLYVWGVVYYFDGFTDGRFTKFCHRYGAHMATISNIPAESARHHQYGNETDEK